MYDTVFGDLTYDGGWSKTEELKIWGKEQSIRIVVSAYEYEKPTDVQKDAYNRLKKDLDLISSLSLKKLKAYIKDIEADILFYCKLDELPDDIFELVAIENILFLESGSFAILCKAKWDSHGVAVLCQEFKVEAGPQDIVWMEE